MFPLRTKFSLADQIERINDQSRGNVVDVIVQLQGSSGKDTGLKKAASDLLSRRRMSLGPREMINAQTMKTRRVRGTRKKSSPAASPITKQKRSAISDLNSMSKAPSVAQALARMETSHKKRKDTHRGASKYKPALFWSSQSMFLQLTKSELQSLPSEVPNIRDVHVNRRLSVPIIKVNKPLATETEDRLSTTWGIDRTNAYGAWGVYGAEGQDVTVAVLDTGIDADHPILAGKVADWAEFDDMGNIVDTQNPRDSDEHGTHVAGTIAGGNASGRWIGMAPQARIAAGLVLDGAIGGTDAQVLAGMQWAIDRGVDVINMSLGGLVMDAETPPTYTEAIISAIIAGIPVVCAIGNDGSQTSGLPGSDLFALSVGATDHGDRGVGFSGGRTQIIFESDFVNPDLLPLPYIKPDLTAPGVAVVSSVPGGGLSAFSGTSMATPHVSGAIALLLSATNIRNMLSGADRAFTISDLITGSVDDIGENGQDSRFGFGRLDALRAIDFAVREGFGIDG